MGQSIKLKASDFAPKTIYLEEPVVKITCEPEKPRKYQSDFVWFTLHVALPLGVINGLAAVAIRILVGG